MANVFVSSINSKRVENILKKHGTQFKVIRRAGALDFIGSSFLTNQNEFNMIECKCCEPASAYWVSHNEAKITYETGANYNDK